MSVGGGGLDQNSFQIFSTSDHHPLYPATDIKGRFLHWTVVCCSIFCSRDV